MSVYIFTFDSEHGHETWLITGRSDRRKGLERLQRQIYEITSSAEIVDNVKIQEVDPSVKHHGLLAIEPYETGSGTDLAL